MQCDLPARQFLTQKVSSVVLNTYCVYVFMVISDDEMMYNNILIIREDDVKIIKVYNGY